MEIGWVVTSVDGVSVSPSTIEREVLPPRLLLVTSSTPLLFHSPGYPNYPAVCTKVAKRKDAGQVFILFGFSPLAPNLGEGACVSAGEGGGNGAMTREEIFLHLVNHATYHRGFVNDMMYQVPAKPPSNDLPVYLREFAQSIST